MTTVTMPRLNVVSADQDPTIGDLTPGALIYRNARVTTAGQIISTLPCHRQDVVSLDYNPENLIVDRLVICRSCRITYEVTPVPPVAGNPVRMVYRITDQTILISRPARRTELR